MDSEQKKLVKRKVSHIELALNSSMPIVADERFYYEPMLSSHQNVKNEYQFLGKKLLAPIWISSMTGGIAQSQQINQNLAKVAKRFRIGLALGSCRSLLSSEEHFSSFDLRDILGDDLPFFANFGVAQIERMIAGNGLIKVKELVNRLRADGVIIHVNPLQEWLQPEGDRFNCTPLDTIKRFLDLGDTPLIVKEVGQGMGPQSIEGLLQLPLAALEFGAFGGTNFTQIEYQRAASSNVQADGFAVIGHCADEMLKIANGIRAKLQKRCLCQNIIISGGIGSPLDGYYLIEKSQFNSVYGIAGRLLKPALESEACLIEFFTNEIESFKMAEKFLEIKKNGN